MENIPTDVSYRFAGFRLDLACGALFTAAGKEAPLRRKSFLVLRLLVENAGKLIGRDTINQAIWADVAVSDDSITQCIHEIRHAFGDKAQRILRTVRGRGYLLAAEVTTVGARRVSPRHRKPRPVPPSLSMIVLPFANLSNDPEQECFVDSITDDLTNDLSRIPGCLVISRNTAFTFKGKAVDVKRLGQQLGIRYVIEGSVRRLGDQVLVSVQLLDAELRVHLWTERFAADLTDLLETQNEITGRLSATLNVEVAKAAGRRIEHEASANPTARDLVLRARGILSSGYSAANSEAARQLYRDALRSDPKSIDAKIGLGRALTQRVVSGWSVSPKDDGVLAEHLLREVQQHRPNDPGAHLALGVLRRYQNRLTEAQAELETAISLDRNEPAAHRNLGLTLVQLGQPESAIPYFEKSLRLGPHDPYVAANYLGLGRCYLYLGRTEQAIDVLEMARAANSNLYGVLFYLAAAFGLRRQIPEARATLAETVKLFPRLTSVAAWWAANPAHSSAALRPFIEGTVCVGLRNAGLPER